MLKLPNIRIGTLIGMGAINKNTFEGARGRAYWKESGKSNRYGKVNSKPLRLRIE